MGDGADVVRGDITVHVGDNALGQVVSLDLVCQRQLAQTGSTVPVTADNALNHTFVTVVVAAGTVAVALTCCEKQGQILRMASLKETLFQRLRQCFRASAAYKTAGCNGIAVLYEQGSFVCGQNPYFLHEASSSFYISL